MRMIYLSHPYTGNEQANRFHAHRIAAGLAREHPGIVFLNPINAMRHTVTAGLDYDTVIRQCLEILSRCDGIIMAGEWRESRGCMAEFRAAQGIGMQIYDGAGEFARECREGQETP